MTAGRGILHSEMPQQENGLMWGFQLWVNLPAKDKMTEPRYQDIAPERIPVVHPAEGVEVRVVAGDFGGASGPVSGVATAPIYLDIALAAGARAERAVAGSGTARLPTCSTAATAQVAGETLARSELAVLGKGDRVQLVGGDAPSRVLLVAGQPLNEPVARYGPFVMNTRRADPRGDRRLPRRQVLSRGMGLLDDRTVRPGWHRRHRQRAHGWQAGALFWLALALSLSGTLFVLRCIVRGHAARDLRSLRIGLLLLAVAVPAWWLAPSSRGDEAQRTGCSAPDVARCLRKPSPRMR